MGVPEMRAGVRDMTPAYGPPGWECAAVILVFLAVLPAAAWGADRFMAWRADRRARAVLRWYAKARHPAGKSLSPRDLEWLKSIESADLNTKETR